MARCSRMIAISRLLASRPPNSGGQREPQPAGGVGPAAHLAEQLLPLLRGARRRSRSRCGRTRGGGRRSGCCRPAASSGLISALDEVVELVERRLDVGRDVEVHAREPRSGSRMKGGRPAIRPTGHPLPTGGPMRRLLSRMRPRRTTPTYVAGGRVPCRTHGAGRDNSAGRPFARHVLVAGARGPTAGMMRPCASASTDPASSPRERRSGSSSTTPRRPRPPASARTGWPSSASPTPSPPSPPWAAPPARSRSAPR